MPYKNSVVRKKFHRDYYHKTRKINPIKVGLNVKRKRCKEKNILFKLDKNWAVSNYTGKCELTGLTFRLSKIVSPWTPALDRVNSKKGYTKINTRIVLQGINSLKGTGTDADMYTIAEALLKHRKRIKHGK